MMEILACTTGFLLLGLLLLLALPVELRLHLENGNAPVYEARLHWLFGLVSVDLTKIAGAAVRKKLPKKPKRKKPHIAGLHDGHVSFSQVLGLLRRLLRSVQIKELTLYGRIGLGDPACTGELMGALQPLLHLTRNTSLVADYQEAVFEGRCRARIRVVPIRVLGVFLLFFINNELRYSKRIDS